MQLFFSEIGNDIFNQAELNEIKINENHEKVYAKMSEIHEFGGVFTKMNEIV